MIMLSLPYPPSTNGIWRRVDNKTILSGAARAYRTAVAKTILQAKAQGHFATGLLPLNGRLSLSLTLISPNNTRRDLDNFIKAAQDALTHAGIWRDDAQIDDLHIVRGPIDKQNPRLDLVITVLPPQISQPL